MSILARCRYASGVDKVTGQISGPTRQFSPTKTSHPPSSVSCSFRQRLSEPNIAPVRPPRQELSPTRRAIIYILRKEGKSFREIEDRLGIPKSTVKDTLSLIERNITNGADNISSLYLLGLEDRINFCLATLGLSVVPPFKTGRPVGFEKSWNEIRPHKTGFPENHNNHPPRVPSSCSPTDTIRTVKNGPNSPQTAGIS